LQHDAFLLFNCTLENESAFFKSNFKLLLFIINYFLTYCVITRNFLKKYQLKCFLFYQYIYIYIAICVKYGIYDNK